MPIVAKAGPTIIPAPEGNHSAVCVDIVDLGTLSVTYGKETKEQHKVRIVWQIDEDRPDGKPFEVSQRFTLSLHEKAGLRKALESWRGKHFSEQELEGFDLEVLLGKPCMVNVIHNVKSGSTYANVTAVSRLPKGLPPISARDYVRVCDRKPEDVSQAPGNDFGGITDDDVPF